jgi:hypothetical protein
MKHMLFWLCTQPDSECYRFYISSEVTPEQGLQPNINSEAHAIAFFRLVNTPEQAQWEQRYIFSSYSRSIF